jgi:hypothetical protein
MQTVTVPNLGPSETRQLADVNLQNSTSGKEISGYVGIAKGGITVKLYQITCVDTLIAVTTTCSDGKYSFSGLEDGSDFPDNATYRVEPCCSVCTFNPTSIANIQIPVPSGTTYNFTIDNPAGCNTGACQPCP